MSNYTDPFLAIVNKAAKDLSEQVSLWEDTEPFGCILESGIAGENSRSIFSFRGIFPLITQMALVLFPTISEEVLSFFPNNKKNVCHLLFFLP